MGCTAGTRGYEQEAHPLMAGVHGVKVNEKERLLEVAEALRGKLAYFDELERVAAHFHGAALDVDSERFLPLLQRLDECIS